MFNSINIDENKLKPYNVKNKLACGILENKHKVLKFIGNEPRMRHQFCFCSSRL